MSKSDFLKNASAPILSYSRVLGGVIPPILAYRGVGYWWFLLLRYFSSRRDGRGDRPLSKHGFRLGVQPGTSIVHDSDKNTFCQLLSTLKRRFLCPEHVTKMYACNPRVWLEY